MKKLLIIFCCLIVCTLHSAEKTVALLFLTRAHLNQDKIWKDWIDLSKYTVYIHSKFSFYDKRFSKYRIKDTQPTHWGLILYAQRALLREALKDPKNYKFVFLSESCIPLWPSQKVHEILTSCPESHMRVIGPWWEKDSSRTLVEFPEENRWGNHTWIILNRKHAQMLADDDYWIHFAMRHIACDEAYPSTFFSMHGLLPEFRNEFTTFVDWNRGGPYVFEKETYENHLILLNAKKTQLNESGEPCLFLFARKFSKSFPRKVIKQLIESP